MNRKAIIRFLIFIFAIANASYFYPLERGSRTVYSQGQDAILLIEDQVELNQIREAGCHPIQLGPPYTHPWEECTAIEVVATYVDAMNGDRPISGLAMMIISGKPPHTGATTQEAMVSMLTDEGWTGAVPLYPGAYDLETHAIDTVRPYSSDLSPYLQFLGDELTQKMRDRCNGSADPVQVVASRKSNQLRRPNDVTVVDKKYIIAQQGSNPKNAGLRIFDSSTGSSSLILRNGPIGRPLGVTTDGTDYVVSSLLNNVNDGAFFRVSQAGTVTGSLLLPSDTRPFDIAYDSANDLFIATETISASIVVIDRAFTHAQIFPIPGLSRGSNAPAGITVQGPGDYIITDELTGELFRLQESSPGSAAIGQFNSLTTLASGLGVAVGVTLDGNDYIVTDSNGRLLRVSGGSVAEIRSTTGLLGNPTGLTTLRSGNYLVLDYNGDRLLEITDCPD